MSEVREYRGFLYRWTGWKPIEGTPKVAGQWFAELPATSEREAVYIYANAEIDMRCWKNPDTPYSNLAEQAEYVLKDKIDDWYKKQEPKQG